MKPKPQDSAVTFEGRYGGAEVTATAWLRSGDPSDDQEALAGLARIAEALAVVQPHPRAARMTITVAWPVRKPVGAPKAVPKETA